MQTLSTIKSLLESRGLSPKRSLGQNFLVDQNLLRKLIDAAGVEAGDIVLEVGPGTGVLTEELLLRVGRTGRVIACELDDSLAAMLTERAEAREFENADRLSVVHSDCLESKEELAEPLRLALKDAAGTDGAKTFKLVANLPYGAATPLILTLLLKYPTCTTLAVTIQQEVAERLLAKPRTSERGMLSVIAQAMSDLQLVATLPRECFWPRPDVTSAMVLARRRTTPVVSDPHRFSEYCKRLFAQRRKQLGGVLGRDTRWPDGVTAQSRAEELTLDQALALFHTSSTMKAE